MRKKRLEKISKELKKGFLNQLIYGREGYFISPDGEIRAISDNELEKVLNEGTVQEVTYRSFDSIKSAFD